MYKNEHGEYLVNLGRGAVWRKDIYGAIPIQFVGKKQKNDSHFDEYVTTITDERVPLSELTSPTKYSTQIQEQEYSDEIEARKNGYANYLEYRKAKDTQKRNELNKKYEDIKNSYFGQNIKKGKSYYGLYNNGEEIEIQPQAAIELFVRRAKALGAEEYHHSAKSGSKFSTSIYLEKDGVSVRISDHFLPDTAEREYKYSQTGGPSWNSEVIFPVELRGGQPTNRTAQNKRRV